MSTLPTNPKASFGHRSLTLGLVALSAGLILAVVWRGNGEAAVHPRGPVGARDEGGTGEGANQAYPDRVDEGRVHDAVYSDLISLASRDRRMFRAKAIRTLLEAAVPEHRLDALRALHDIDGLDAVPILERVLADPQTPVVVRDYAFGQILPRCAADERARDAMLGFLQLRPDDAKQRASAFGEVLHHGTGRQVEACMPMVLSEGEPDVVVEAIEGLRENREPELRNRVETLHWRHPDAKVRKRLRTLGIGR